MKNGAIVYVFNLILILSFWGGCASHSETVMLHDLGVQPTVIVKKMGIPFSIDSVAKNSELRHVSVWDSIDLPTLAALDFAAYYQNPIREAGKQELPENAKPLTAEFGAYPFPMFDSLVAEEPEFAQILNPIAWEPFSKILYAKGAGDSLAQVFRSVESVKWGSRTSLPISKKLKSSICLAPISSTAHGGFRSFRESGQESRRFGQGLSGSLLKRKSIFSSVTLRSA